MADAKPQDTVVRYGPRKIGEEAFEKQQAEKVRSSRGGTVYGDRKMNPEPPGEEPSEPEAEADPDIEPDADAEVETDSTEGGPEIAPEGEAGPDTEPDNPFNPEGDEDGSGYTTLEELTATLEEDPSLLDLAIDAEKAREDGPRKGAVRLFTELELEKDEPREDVIVELEELLEEL